MPLDKHILVVANQTLESQDLLDAIADEAGSDGAELRVTFLVPSLPRDRGTNRTRLDELVRQVSERGISASGILGDSIATVAVAEAWSPGRYDEVVISTLPAPVSKWLGIDLPRRVAELTGCNVRHVVTPEPLKAGGDRRPATGTRVAHADRQRHLLRTLTAA